MNRKGEKIGWIGGWFGSFLWIGLLSVFWMLQNQITSGILGIIIFGVASITIVTITPWKYPNTKYWKLMSPIYILFFTAIVLCMYCYGRSANLKWTSFSWVLPCLLPFIMLGNRTWNDNSR